VAQIFGTRDFQIAPASADASFRRYFRVTLGSTNPTHADAPAVQSWIAMDAPPDKEDMDPYIRVAAMLRNAGVNAPRILARNAREGFLLNSDLGSQTYLAALEQGVDADGLYGDAIEALLRIQTGAASHASVLPAYDEAMLRREMALFPEWFCGRHLGLAATHSLAAALEPAFEVLCRTALEQPRVFVHRDYHSRNLMVCRGMVCRGSGPDLNPGILDFQDAVRGPVTYDLVSLLRDCYVAWPDERVRHWMARFRDGALSLGMPCGPDEPTFRRWFDLMGVQRHLKAIGIFARLWHRDGKPGYLQDIPRTLDYVRAVSREHQELRALGTFIDLQVAPALKKLADSDSPIGGAAREARMTSSPDAGSGA